MTKWFVAVGLILMLVVGVFFGHWAFPRVLVQPAPAPAVNHQIETDTLQPFPIMGVQQAAVCTVCVVRTVTVATVPIPPVPEVRPVPQVQFWVPQRQMLYGFSIKNGVLTASIFDSLPPHYRQEKMSGVQQNVYMAWMRDAGSWSIQSWPNATPAPVPVVVVAKPRAWRPTIEAGLSWYPGDSAIVVTASPGILVLGHLKASLDAQLTLNQIIAKSWRAARIGAGVSIVF